MTMLIDVDTLPAGARGGRRTSRFWAPRTGPIAHLREALASDVVLVRGPAGVGKTSLLRQFATSLHDDPDLGVQIIDGSTTTPEHLIRIAQAFAEGPSRHVLLVDNHTEGVGVTSEDLLDMLRADEELRIVVATRYATGLESPLVALEFDVHIVAPHRLRMTRDELALVLELNGIETTEVAVDELADHTHGWLALGQLASARLRLEALSLRTRDEAIAVAEYANEALTTDMEERLGIPITDEVRLLAVAPYINAALADAMGIDSRSGGTAELLVHLQRAGFVWPSSTRLVLAEPLRQHWLRHISAREPELVASSRVRLLDHLVSAGEPLLAAQLAADADQWRTVASILRTSAPEIWARDEEAFAHVLARLRASSPTAPLAVEALLALDPETALSPETPGLAVAALNGLPDAKTAATGNLEGLTLRVSLLRAAGRFALATEAASLLIDRLRRVREHEPTATAEGWYQAGMTALAMGRLRDAAQSLRQAESLAPPARRTRARGALAVIALLDGDVRGAASIVEENRDDIWLSSPWGEGLRIARAWLQLEAGDAVSARSLLDEIPSTQGARELWPYAASIHALAFLLSGAASDALALLRTWSGRARSVPPSHYQSTQLLTARAKVLIALRQAKKALALFEGPFALSPATAPAIALSHLYAGRTHDAFVMSVKWGLHSEPAPRAALESLVVSVVADVRLNGVTAHRTAAQRAESLSMRHDLWSPWSAVAPEDRALVLQMLSPAARERVTRLSSFFASSVSVPHLTKREQVVLTHLTPTSTIADIARILVVSPNTVKTQLQSLYRKLEVSDRSSAIRAAHTWGLIETETEA